MSNQNINVKFKGVEIELYGEKYQMPALSPYAFAKAEASEKFDKIQKEVKKASETGEMGALSSDSYMTLIELVTLALNRNYPEVTQDMVGEGLEDSGLLMTLMQDLISQNQKLKEQMAEHIKNVQK